MNLKYFKNITKDSYEMFLFGDIGYEINGSYFAQDLKWLAENGAKEIIIRINSGGGSIIDGFSIISAIMNSPVNVITSNEGIAASMAGIIFVVGKKRICKDFSKLMIHDPSCEGEKEEETEDENTKKTLAALKDSLITILTNNSKLTRPQVKQLMSEETWFSAQEAKDLGLADVIETTKLRITSSTPITEYMNICSTYFKNNLTKTDMDLSLLTNHLKLQDGASLEQILNSVKTLETKNQTLAKELENVTSLVAEKNTTIVELTNSLMDSVKEKEILESELKKVHEKEINSFVDSCVESGKISLGSKEEALESAKQNFENFKKVISWIPEKTTKSEDITKVINQDTDVEDRAKWTYEDWSKKDVKGLSNMQLAEPARFEKLLNSHIENLK